jgi:hypothetical protein
MLEEGEEEEEEEEEAMRRGHGSNSKSNQAGHSEKSKARMPAVNSSSPIKIGGPKDNYSSITSFGDK